MRKNTLLGLLAFAFAFPLVGCGENKPSGFTVTWLNYDGTTLEVDESVLDGEIPSYDGDIPVRLSSSQYSYCFEGWSPAISEVHSNQTYVAQYISNVNSYTITWDVEGVKTTETYNFGETPYYKNATPTKETTSQYTFAFSGWSPQITNVTCNTTYVATFEPTLREYVVSFNSNGGTVIESQTLKYGEKVTNPGNCEKPGYNFVKWTNQGDEWSFDNDVITDNVTLDANWSDPITYSISYNLDGGTNNASNPTSYTVVDELTLHDPTKQYYTFRGWYNDNTLVESIKPGMTGNLTLTAHWNYVPYHVSVLNINSDKGTVSGGGDYAYGSEVSLIATPNAGYSFKGWFTDPDCYNRITDSKTYKFTIREEKVFYAAFWSLEEEQSWKEAHGILPVLNSQNSTVTYGLYPQVVVSDNLLIYELNKLDNSYIDSKTGWYFYNDEFYTQATAICILVNFDDGTSIQNGATYWFKCKPIEWKVLLDNDGELLLLSSQLLDMHKFDDSPTTYQDSDVRTWLLNDFKNKAFAFDDSIIHPSILTNNDPISFLTKDDYKNTALGFVYSETFTDSRVCYTTEWVRARRQNSYSDGSGDYWTRTSDSESNAYAIFVTNKGSMNPREVSDSNCCIRPCISIIIE